MILILFLTNTTLSTTSMMGIIMMLGIVVSNGVLLVDYTNVLRRRGLALRDAVVTGARTRLRPILMTSLATVVGLLPMAIGLGHRRRNQCAAGPRGRRRAHRLDDPDALSGSDRLCDVGGTVSAEHRTTG